MRRWNREPAYLTSYAESVTRLKGLAGDEQAQRVHETIRTAFNHVYKAVALDIDGTLTGPDGTDIDLAMATTIVGQLRRDVSVYLITGRGRSGARQAARQILQAARANMAQHKLGRSIGRLHVIAYNGTLLLSTEIDDPSTPDIQPLTAETRLTPPVPSQQWKSEIDELLAPHLDQLQIDETAGGVRIISLTNTLPEGVMEVAKNWCAGADFPDLHLTAATYSGKPTIDLGTANKGTAVRICAERLGISPNEILRIGDQGQLDGNDFDLLNSPAGFSVQLFSNDPDGCNPVLDDEFQPLVGAAATRHLLNQLYLFSPLSVNKVDFDDYRRRFAVFEQKAAERSREESAMLERRLTVRMRNLFSDEDAQQRTSITAATLFDTRSGAVRVTNWELEQLRSNPAVSTLFELDKLERRTYLEHGPRWCMYSDSALLLRGPYYYRSESQPKDRNPDLIGPFIDDIRHFMANARPVLDGLLDRDQRAEPNLLDVKVLLGIADNVRNAVLCVTHLALQLAEKDAKPTADDRALVTRVGNSMLIPHTDAHVAILFDSNLPWSRTVTEYQTVLTKIDLVMTELSEILPARYRDRSETAEAWYAGFLESKEAFKWREADHMLQNLAAVDMGLRRLVPPSDDKGPYAVGLTYGGLELPALAYVLGSRLGRPVRPAVAHVSLYSDATTRAKLKSSPDRYIDDLLDTRGPVLPLLDDDSTDSSGPEGIVFAGDHAIVLDDNNTTAQTLQVARDLLVYRDADVLGAVIVRFPGVNRTPHMNLPDHGYLDLDAAFSFVWGFVASSPYTRLVVEGLTEKQQYEDENGVFDKAKQRIKYLLRKNDPQALGETVWPKPQVLINPPSDGDAEAPVPSVPTPPADAR